MPNVFIEARNIAQAEFAGFLRRNNKPCAVECDAAGAQPVIRPQRNGRRRVRSDGQIGVNQAVAFGELDFSRSLAFSGLFGLDPQQLPFARAGLRHGHGDANRRAVHGIDPWVIGNRKHQRGRAGRIREMRGHDPPLKGLAQAVGGDETKPPGLARADAFGGAVPPIHHVIGGLGDLGVHRAERLGVAVAEFAAHSPVAQERRVAHDKIGRGPFGAPGVFVNQDRAAGRLVGNFLARYGVTLFGDAVPHRARVSVFIDGGLHLVVRQQRVAVLDIVEPFDDGLGWSRGGAPRAEVPLEVTDPQDQVGDGGGAGIELDSPQLVRIDGEPGFVQSLLAFPQAFERVVDLGFQALEMFEGDV